MNESHKHDANCKHESERPLQDVLNESNKIKQKPKAPEIPAWIKEEQEKFQKIYDAIGKNNFELAEGTNLVTKLREATGLDRADIRRFLKIMRKEMKHNDRQVRRAAGL